MKTKTIETYTIDELSEEVKEIALQNVQAEAGCLEYGWWDFIYDDAIVKAKILGIEIDKIYFSGFGSQGDGACFEGSYCYAKGSVKNIKTEYPQNKELRKIAEELQALQKRYFYRLEASVKHSGRHCHELCTNINVYNNGMADTNAAELLTELLRDFMRHIYSTLQDEYEYLTSYDALTEYARDNEYIFNAIGTILDIPD